MGGSAFKGGVGSMVRIFSQSYQLLASNLDIEIALLLPDDRGTPHSTAKRMHWPYGGIDQLCER